MDMGCQYKEEKSYFFSMPTAKKIHNNSIRKVETFKGEVERERERFHQRTKTAYLEKSVDTSNAVS